MTVETYLAELLVRRGVVPPDRLDEVLQTALEKGQSLSDVITSGKIAGAEQIARALADELGLGLMPSIDVMSVPLNVAERIPITYAKQHKILVLAEDEQRVYAVIADPLDVTAVDDVRTVFGKPVELALAPSDAVTDAINRVWERKEDGGTGLKADHDAEEDNLVDILDADDDAPIIAWVNSLFSLAVRERASDIHIEPEERDVVVRYRVDGELYVARRASKQFISAIIARIKIMASLNIAEKRLPQDGRITKRIAGKSFDIRVSTIPTSRGYERVVMRLLNKSTVLLDLTELGFSERDYLLMDSLIHKPDGIILVTGPTGSGKTTTLYACVNRINQPNLNILTAEDPVEYEIAGIHQVHVQPKIGLTFANALRAFLRQDPDVVMVGEIRDKETAEGAINASLTGHLVLSTIHTNDAAGAVTRLIDMGVEPFLIRSSLIGAIAQRLVRVLCPNCKEAYPAEPSEVDELGLSRERLALRQRRVASGTSRYYPRALSEHDPLDIDSSVRPMFFRPRGCDRCANTGFSGRRAIYEMLLVDDAVGPLILKSSDAQAMKRAAVDQGMDSLRDDGARKVLMGMTSVEEVLAATQEDIEIAPSSMASLRTTTATGPATARGGE